MRDRKQSIAAGPGRRIQRLRGERGWSQAELAARAGVSRPAISALETGRLVPSVASALAIARVLGVTVESLFSADAAEDEPPWAWPPPCAGKPTGRAWAARIGGRTLLFPAETTPAGVVAHDVYAAGGRLRAAGDHFPEETLVVATCDPAAALLAEEYARRTPFRMLVLARASRRALELVQQGMVHAGGVHLGKEKGNEQSVRRLVGDGSSLLHVAQWEEGVVLAPGARTRSLRSAIRSKLVWVGREPGSAARECLDELLEGRRAPRRIARDHRGVAEAILCGWGQAGVCVRLCGEEASLPFLPVRREAYELCFRADAEGDPRIAALIDTVQGARYRRLLADLPGYDPRRAGELRRVAP